MASSTAAGCEPRLSWRRLRRTAGDRHLHTWSELTPCNAHLRQLAERVKRGVWRLAGFRWSSRHVHGRNQPTSHGHALPNLVSMDVEESIRGNPVTELCDVRVAIKTNAVLGDGRGQLRHPMPWLFRRAYVERQVSRQGYWVGYGRLALQRSSESRDHVRRRSSVRPSPACRARRAHCMTWEPRRP